MTQDEIIALAKRVGFPIHHPEWQKAVEEFAALVEEKAIATEREACEKVADDFAENMRGMAQWGANEVFKAIRARWQA